MVVTYNSRNPAVKRLMKEAQELSEPTELYFAKPLEDNLFEWHFTIRGPEDSDFQGGLYHGRILLPSEYPMKPPNIVLLTPNGRFEIHRKICLSISGYHPESWRPSWSIRTALLALIGFMPTHGVGAIGSLNQPKEERQLLALKSQSYVCSICGPTNNLLLPLTTASSSMNKEASEAAAQISMMSEEEFRNKKALTNSNTPTTTTTIANNNDHQTNSVSGITSQSNLSTGNLINPSLTPSTSSYTTPCAMPSSSSPTQSNTANIAENMNSYLWTGFPSYMYPYRNENIPPQIAYWLCFPVYYPVSPFPMNASSSSSVTTGLNSTIDSGTASGERVPLSFGEWLKEIREKEKSSGTSVQDTVSPSSSSSTTTTTIIDTTQVTYMSHSNENIKPTTSKTLSPANQSKEVVDSSENQVHTITETISSQNKNESDTKELSSSSITDKSPEYDSMKQTNSHEYKIPNSPLVDGGTSSKIIDNSNTIETNESCKENKSEIQQTDRLHHRIMNQSMNTLNHHDNNRISNEHIRQSTSFVQYHPATVCAVGVAIALFIIVMRRLAIIFQDV